MRSRRPRTCATTSPSSSRGFSRAGLLWRPLPQRSRCRWGSGPQWASRDPRSRDPLQQLDRLRFLLVSHIGRGDLFEIRTRRALIVALHVRAGDPEPGVDDVLILGEAMRLHCYLERRHGVVVASFRVVDAAEKPLDIEVVVRGLIYPANP